MLPGLKIVQSISAFFSVQKRVQSLMLISCIIWVVPSPTAPKSVMLTVLSGICGV